MACMSRVQVTFAALVVAVVLCPARESLANSAAPTTYTTTVEGNRVTVCPWNFDDRMCPDEGLVRKKVGSRDAVRLSDCDAERCFVDECVPPGEYQYGFAKPYACVPASASTDYFVEVEVAAEGEPGACQRTEGFAGPVPHPDGAPWGLDRTVCQYGPMGCSCNEGAAVISVNALVLAAGLLLLRRHRRQRREG